MSAIVVILIALSSTEKSYTYLLNSGCFNLSTVKYSEMRPKHNGHGFVFNFWI